MAANPAQDTAKQPLFGHLGDGTQKGSASGRSRNQVIARKKAAVKREGPPAPPEVNRESPPSGKNFRPQVNHNHDRQGRSPSRGRELSPRDWRKKPCKKPWGEASPEEKVSRSRKPRWRTLLAWPRNPALGGRQEAPEVANLAIDEGRLQNALDVDQDPTIANQQGEARLPQIQVPLWLTASTSASRRSISSI